MGFLLLYFTKQQIVNTIVDEYLQHCYLLLWRRSWRATNVIPRYRNLCFGLLPRKTGSSHYVDFSRPWLYMNLINVGYKDQQQILSRKLELEN